MCNGRESRAQQGEKTAIAVAPARPRRRTDSVAASRLLVLQCQPASPEQIEIQSFLEEEGFAVTHNDSAEVLANQLGSIQPQILLLELPERARSVEQLLASVRAYDRDLCVISLTRTPSVESAVAAMKYQVFEYLSAPWRMSALREVLDAAIEEKGLHVSLEQRLNREIGQQIRTRRSSTGLTLRQVANRTGLSISLISQIELGKSAASVSTLYKLSRALHVQVGHFFEAV